jgi:hypothetical protein
MKTYIKSLSILPLAVMFIAMTFASSALASPPPFKIHGSYEALELHVVSFPLLDVDLDAVGQTSVLGRYALHEDATSDLLTGGATGITKIVTQSGDQLFTTSNNLVTPDENPAKLNIVETHMITGGTGRFACAKGTIIIERVLDLGTLLSEGTIKGTIAIP